MAMISSLIVMAGDYFLVVAELKELVLELRVNSACEDPRGSAQTK
tara:strand:- start:359 stop:493 length:135 start_codon:yes stop_codon:yes gene_type:complete